MEVLCSNTATGIYTIIFFTDSTSERIQFRGNLNEFMQVKKLFFRICVSKRSSRSYMLQEDVPDVPGSAVRTGPSVRLHAHDGLRARGRQEIQIQVSTRCVCVCVCVCVYHSHIV